MPINCNPQEIPLIELNQTVLSIAKKPETNQKRKNVSRFDSYTSKGKTEDPSSDVNWKMPQPRAHNILTTPSPENFILDHKIAHQLRSLHWWSADECKYPLPLSLAEKLKEWCFSDSVE